MRRSMLFVLAAVTAVSLIPGSSSATHCSDLIVYSGQRLLPADSAASPGLVNVGSAGCAHGAAHEDTNVLTPGATTLAVGYLNITGAAPENGRVRFSDGSEVALTWTKTTRYQSQDVAIPAGVTGLTASADVVVTTDGVAVPKFISVTYRAA